MIFFSDYDLGLIGKGSKNPKKVPDPKVEPNVDFGLSGGIEGGKF